MRSRRVARPARIALAALLGAAGASCSSTAARRDSGADDVVFTDPRAAICAEAGASPGYDLIQRIFDAECASCHSAATDLVLTPSPEVSWGNLVGKPAPPAEACGGTLVVPGDPGSSYLYQKLSSPTPCAGTRMPAAEFGPQPLPDCVLALVREWIAEGAPGPLGDASAD
jgi:cytochrome c5